MPVMSPTLFLEMLKLEKQVHLKTDAIRQMPALDFLVV